MKMANARHYLVLVTAREESQHVHWFLPDRTYDIWVVYGGSDNEIMQRYKATCDHFISDLKGSKESIVTLLQKDDLKAYEYVWLPDDDLHCYFGTDMINTMFAAAKEIRADWFQPASVDHIVNKFVSDDQACSQRRTDALYHTVNYAARRSFGFSSRALLGALIPAYDRGGEVEDSVEELLKEIPNVMTVVFDMLPIYSTRPRASNLQKRLQETYEVYQKAE
jgi:hypothetical protein